MHVCHLCDNSLETHYFKSIARGALRHGLDLSFVQLTTGRPPSWLPEFPGVRFHSLRSDGKISFIAAARRLAKLIAAEKIDILQTHLFNSGLTGVLSKRFGSNALTILTRHHTGVVRMLGTRLHVAADRWMAEKADRVITVSEAARQYMIETDNIRRDDIEVVHIGFDFDTWSPDRALGTQFRSEFGIGDNEFVIGYLANVTPGKGHVQLIEAFKKISVELRGARLLFAGAGMPEEVRSGAAALGSKVIFAGWRNDARAFLNSLDLFVQPSLSEAFSQVVIEAMGVGLPVIATNVGGAKEVIDNGVNGLLVEPNDPDELYRAMETVIRDPEFGSRIAEAGQRSVRSRFTIDRMGERHRELYEKWTANN